MVVQGAAGAGCCTLQVAAGCRGAGCGAACHDQCTAWRLHMSLKPLPWTQRIVPLAEQEITARQQSCDVSIWLAHVLAVVATWADMR